MMTRQGNRQLELGRDQVGADEVLQHAHEEAAHHGAARARDAAEERSCKGIEQHAAHHVGVEKEHRRHHDAGDGTDRRREAPADRQHPAHADADEPRRDRVLRRRAHGEAERGEAEEDVEQRQHDERHPDHAELARGDHVAQERRIAEGAREFLDRVGEDPARRAVEDDEEPDEDDDLGEHGCVLDGSDDDALDEDAAEEGDGHGQHKGGPEGQPRLDQRPGDVGGEHRHLALGEIHRFRRLVDHDERQRQARIDGARGEAGEDLLEELIHARRLVPGTVDA